jgi:hypothetical protein
MFENDYFVDSVFDDMDVPPAYRGTWASDNCPGIAWESGACGYVRGSVLRESIAEYERMNEWN